VHRGPDGTIIGPVAPDLNGRQDFRSLMSELGVVLSPRMPMVAGTTGIAGFQLSAELGLMEISNNRRFWNGVAGVSENNPAATRPDSRLTTVGGFVRKGIWLPVPTMELGFGAVHLLDSHLLAWQGYAKVALHEGSGRWTPALSVRWALSYLTGTDQVNMTTTSFDFLASKGFGLLKTARMEPFVGGGLVAIFAHSKTIDATPSCDATRIAAGLDAGNPYCSPSQVRTKDDFKADFSFPNQNAITRYRLFAGLKIKFAVVFFAAQYEAFFAGSSADGNAASAKDQSGTQNALSLSAGLDF
jgi:hypothetical protein